MVFPEAFLSGYPKGLDFGARVGTRSREGREMFRRYFESALCLESAAADRLRDIVHKHQVLATVGIIEKEGNTLYCTAIFLGADGRLLGRHRKLVPTGVERLIWGRGDGSTLQVVATPFGPLGAAICWENYMPLYRTALYQQGIQWYCAPTVDDRDSWIPTVRHIAVEGRCFVLSACQFARRADYPDDYPAPYGPAPDSVVIRGGSCIVNPFGKLLAGPVYDQEAVLVAEVDPDEVVRGKFDLDVAGHYSRPDVFQLTVNDGTSAKS